MELAVSREREPADYQSAIRACLDDTARLEGVVDALLLLGRAEAASRGGEVFDFRIAVARAMEPAPVMAERLGVPVRASLCDDVLPVMGQVALLERLVANVVENAIAHGASPQGVEVLVKRVHGTAMLMVQDHGPGFPIDLVPHLFERFARGDASRSRATGGVGLGLAIARAIAASHGVLSRPLRIRGVARA